MAIVGRVTRHEIPHEPGEWFGFRELTGFEMDQARMEGVRQASKLVQGLDFSAMRDSGQATADPRELYDKTTLVRWGVTEWSYREECSLEMRDRLDARTRDWAAEVILNMNLRAEGEERSSAGSLNGETSPKNS